MQGEARLGAFTDADGRPVLIVASTQPGREVTARIAVKGGPWEDQISGETFAPADGTLTVPLPPGHGRVLVGR
jgi:hypothetical protein